MFQIASSPTRHKFPLSQKKVIKKTILMMFGWLFAGLVLGGFGCVSALGSGDPTFIVVVLGGVVVLFVILAVISYLYQMWYFATYFYDLTKEFVVIRKGPITPAEITIPILRLQDVNVDQDLWDRLLGLYDVHISSATYASSMEAHIDGLEKEAAYGLRDLLLQTIEHKISKAKK